MIKYRIWILGFLMACVTFVSAQKHEYSTLNKKSIKTYDQALTQFELGYYDASIVLLDKIIKKDPAFIEAYAVKSTIYAIGKNYLLAISFLEKALNRNPDFIPFLHLDLAGLYFKTQQYEAARLKADEYIKRYYPKAKQRRKAQLILESSKFSIYSLKHPKDITPENLGGNINSELKDYLPVLSVDMNTLVFTRTIPDDRTPSGFQEDFYAAFKDGGEWIKAFNIGKPLNTEVNEGGHSLTPDGQAMFFTICDHYGFYGKGRAGHGSCDIFVTLLKNGKWGEAKNLGPKVNKRSHDAQPSMSSDGRTLYFSSTRGGGYGENDIYMSRITSKGWTTPVNLGGVINTPGREEGVFIHPDNQTLYFSSDGHPGLGDNDIFMSKRQPDGSWGKPINLGYPINTAQDEFDFTVDALGGYAYMTSDREGGFGDWDIYRFLLPDSLKPKPVSYMAGKTYDVETNAPLSAKFELKNLANGKKVVESRSNAQGKFFVCLPHGKNYALNASHEGYLFFSESFKLEQPSSLKPVVKDVPMVPIKIGAKVVLKNIFFDVDKFALKEESKVELMKLNEFLEKNPTLKIEIGGHTDNQGSEEHNLILSKNRARSVYEWLIMNKVDKDRLTFEGYGDSAPIKPNDTTEGRRENRRTEFKVISS